MRQRPRIHYVIAWVLAGTAVLANVAGYLYDLYEKWWWFDRVLHGFTLFALTVWLALFYLLDVIQPQRRLGLTTFLLIVAAGIAVGAVWEIAEWTFDLMASSNAIKGKYDTVLDIIMDSIGAVFAAFAVRGLVKRQQAGAPERA